MMMMKETMMMIKKIMMAMINDDYEMMAIGAMTEQYEPRNEKTGLRGFRPSPTQSRLYGHRR